MSYHSLINNSNDHKEKGVGRKNKNNTIEKKHFREMKKNEEVIFHVLNLVYLQAHYFHWFYGA